MAKNMHDYAPAYAALLAPLVANIPSAPVIAEVGILKGTGLAMWSDFLPADATVHGVDCSLARWHAHSAELRAMGAFRRGNVRTHEYDTSSAQFASFASTLPPLDVAIDDGNHTAAHKNASSLPAPVLGEMPALPAAQSK